jgi:hypothetical protein
VIETAATREAAAVGHTLEDYLQLLEQERAEREAPASVQRTTH